jgi:hypothetical protein
MAPDPAIRVERDGAVVTITLCRPERRNALDGFQRLLANPEPAQGITKRALVALGPRAGPGLGRPGPAGT